MNKVLPVRRRFCACGRPCGTDNSTPTKQSDGTTHCAPNSGATTLSSDLQTEKSVFSQSSSFHNPFTSAPPPPPPPGSLDLLQLKIRALEKYKANYELLCSQIAELNTQVGLQLQRHEVDVTTLNGTIASLQTTIGSLQQELHSTKDQLRKCQQASARDSEYASSVHKQLTTVSDLFKASEKRLHEQEKASACESQRLQQELSRLKEENGKLCTDKETMEKQLALLKEQVSKHGDDQKVKKKYRVDIKNLHQEVQELRDELEQQRAVTRHTKKQLKQVKDERDTVAKQLCCVKSDGTHLTEIMESLRCELQRQEKKTHRWKSMHTSSEQKHAETANALGDVESQLMGVQEALVLRNAKVEELMADARELKRNLDHKETEVKMAQQQITALQGDVKKLQIEKEEAAAVHLHIAAGKQEQNNEQQIMQRKYQKEMEHMKQLLSLNYERTSESTSDMQVLKQELSSVQQLLKKCQRQQQQQWDPRPRRSRHSEEGSGQQDEESDNEMCWRVHHQCQRTQVEKAVLQSAIMDQVERAGKMKK